MSDLDWLEYTDSLKAQLSDAIRERDRAINIADGMMAWETPAQARQSAKDLSALKKEIKDNE